MFLMLLCLMQVSNIDCPVMEVPEPLLFGDETLDDIIFSEEAMVNEDFPCEQEFTWEEIKRKR